MESLVTIISYAQTYQSSAHVEPTTTHAASSNLYTTIKFANSFSTEAPSMLNTVAYLPTSSAAVFDVCDENGCIRTTVTANGPLTTNNAQYITTTEPIVELETKGPKPSFITITEKQTVTETATATPTVKRPKPAYPHYVCENGVCTHDRRDIVPGEDVIVISHAHYTRREAMPAPSTTHRHEDRGASMPTDNASIISNGQYTRRDVIVGDDIVVIPKTEDVAAIPTENVSIISSKHYTHYLPMTTQSTTQDAPMPTDAVNSIQDPREPVERGNDVTGYITEVDENGKSWMTWRARLTAPSTFQYRRSGATTAVTESAALISEAPSASQSCGFGMFNCDNGICQRGADCNAVRRSLITLWGTRIPEMTIRVA